MKFRLMVFLSFLVLAAQTAAQPYPNTKTRHRFAQLNLGLDALTQLGHAPSWSPGTNGTLQPFTPGPQVQTRIIIAGTHFWGHADFFIAIPVASFGKSPYRTHVETGAKLYPWRIQEGKIRPYAGISFLPLSYQQGDGAVAVRNRYPLLAGLTYNHKNHLFDIGFGYRHRNTLHYYVSPTVPVEAQTPPFSLSIGYRWMLETTASAEKNWESGHTRALTDTLTKRGQLNGLTLAAGPSTAFFLKEAAHNATLPFLDNHSMTGVFADLGIGYYLHKPDLHFNLAYRGYKSKQQAYGYEQIAQRRSVALEAYKFLFDYHGFVPFLGPALSYEQLRVSETRPGNATTTAGYHGFRPGLSFGWDIRPDRLQAFYLRTNLRYFPRLSVAMPSGLHLPFDALELNFIQLVLFPGRLF